MSQQQLDEEAIFQAARRIPADSRSNYLEHACGNDAQLRSRVEHLIDVYQQDQGFLEPVCDFDLTLDMPTVAEKRDTQLGPYKLREQIGEGGFGVVYVAQQSKPVQRKVALKIIKPGMDTKDVIARFEAERQALALMDHPNVAKVLDAGATDTGRPYFVMELVKGIPITDFCDRHKLSTDERLKLFADVCRAVQHAHQKGIIHRDLKPSNVMVTLHDDKPVVKVIDFGISKALSQQLTENSIYTAYDQMIGTPLYMSPEQAQLSGLDVDTRSDVYSLGVLLYELLTGTTPFDKETLKNAGLDEIRRIIREDEPPRPSARVSTLHAEALSTVSDRRKIDPRKLGQSYRGELDWVVMKALEKDRNRRYESASAFAADVERYLADEPVQACPPSVWYRFRKFARRNNAVLITTVLVAASLLIGAGASAWQWRRAESALATTSRTLTEVERQRDRAQRAEREAAAEAVIVKQQRDRAQRAERLAARESAIAKEADHFLRREILKQSDPYSNPDPDLKLRDVLDRASKRLDGRFQAQPLVKASLHSTIGNAYGALGQYTQAEHHLRQALSIHRRNHKWNQSETADAFFDLSFLLLDRGNSRDYPAARSMCNIALSMRRKLLGESHENTLLASWLYSECRRREGRPEAVTSYEKVLRRAKARWGSEHPATLGIMNGLAVTYHQEKNKRERSERLYRQVLEHARKRMNPDHPNVIMTSANLASLHHEQGRLKRARTEYLSALSDSRRVLGATHPLTIAILNNLACLDSDEGQSKDAEKRLSEVIQAGRNGAGILHPYVMRAIENLASMRLERGKAVAVIPLLNLVLAAERRRKRPSHTSVFIQRTNLTLFSIQALLGNIDEIRSDWPIMVAFSWDNFQGSRLESKSNSLIRLTWKPSLPLRETRPPEHLQRQSDGRSLLSSPTGISVISDRNGDGHNDVLVASAQTDSVLLYCGKTGQMLKPVFSGGGLINPNSPVIGPNRSLYVVSRATSEILRFDPANGEFRDRLRTSYPGVRLTKPLTIVFGPDGKENERDKLYIVDHDLPGVAVFDPRKKREKQLQILFKLNPAKQGGPYGLCFGPDGRLYVSADKKIVRFDLSTRQLSTFIPSGHGGLKSSAYIAFGPQGNLFVCDREAHKVLRFAGPNSPQPGKPLPASGQKGAVYIDSRLKFPVGLAFHANGKLLVTSRNTNEILEFAGPNDPSPGRYLRRFDQPPRSSPKPTPGR